jgi:APA family basic amino acid/polyamine antiporter
MSVHGTPWLGLVVSSVLVSLLMTMNYTKSLVEQFTFIILLATLTALIPYAFSSMAVLMLLFRDRQPARPRHVLGLVALAGLAFLFSLWAIAGAGKEVVYWGFLLLIAGVPVYVWLASQRGSAVRE